MVGLKGGFENSGCDGPCTNTFVGPADEIRLEAHSWLFIYVILIFIFVFIAS